MNTYIQMVIAGIGFGAWPLFMNISGLNGINKTIALEIIMLALALPFFKSQPMSSVTWKWAIASGVVCFVALLAFNYGISKLKPIELYPYLLVMMVVQIAVPSLYYLSLNEWAVSTRELCGFGTAILTAILLVK